MVAVLTYISIAWEYWLDTLE